MHAQVWSPHLLRLLRSSLVALLDQVLHCAFAGQYPDQAQSVMFLLMDCCAGVGQLEGDLATCCQPGLLDRV